jgi:hypothetical protein
LTELPSVVEVLLAKNIDVYRGSKILSFNQFAALLALFEFEEFRAPLGILT